MANLNIQTLLVLLTFVVTAWCKWCPKDGQNYYCSIECCYEQDGVPCCPALKPESDGWSSLPESVQAGIVGFVIFISVGVPLTVLFILCIHKTQPHKTGDALQGKVYCSWQNKQGDIISGVSKTPMSGKIYPQTFGSFTPPHYNEKTSDICKTFTNLLQNDSQPGEKTSFAAPPGQLLLTSYTATPSEISTYFTKSTPVAYLPEVAVCDEITYPSTHVTPAAQTFQSS